MDSLVDLLRSCYVHDKSLRIVVEDLNVVITDSIPKPLVSEGAQVLTQSDLDAGAFGTNLENAVRDRKGELYLLLGGIGCGKTTFLKRYEKLLAKDFLEKKTYTFHLDFLQAPPDIQGLETYLWQSILQILRTSYDSDNIEERKYVKTIFKDKLKNLERTALRGVHKHTEDFEQAISPYLLKWQDNVPDYVPKLLRFASVLKGKTAVLFIDNVDQLDPEYQAHIFLLAQRITRLAGCVTVIALREESYYATSIQNTFTAYTSHKFHIASPQFRAMIGNRIEFALRALEEQNTKILETVFKGRTFDAKSLCDFLRIVQYSVLEWSYLISRFIECICFGNMRLALQMFTTFLISGATDVDKMLNIYRRDNKYNVAFHEFLKAVMLQDRAYYKEDQSPIFNVFNCSSEKNSSHFTALRVVALLLEHRSESTPEGRGYVELSRIVGFFAEVFDNVSDLSWALDRLVTRQLIEVNTRSTRTVSGASHVRVTAAGWYYIRYLARTFIYLDLILQDTPLDDEDLEKILRQSVYEVNNLSDREREKYERMQVRFNRTQRFLDYLTKEEDREFDRFGISRLPKPLSEKFMPVIQDRFKADREYIEKRLQEGRVEDTPLRIDEFPAVQFELASLDIDSEGSEGEKAYRK
jgi:energy-coupling factor transporter ATP-binding protein EcfA2